ELRAVPDEVRDAEHHGLGVALLPRLAIDGQPHVEVLRILDLVLGDEPRSERTEGLAALALHPLTGALDLEHALGDVIGQAIPGDRVHGLALGEIARALADDDAELHLPVELAGLLRDHGVVIGPADAGGHLVEDDRLLGQFQAGFGGMIGIVQADGDEVADFPDAWADAHALPPRGQLLDVRLANPGQARGAKRLACDVRDHLRQVPDPALGIDDTGFFTAGRAEADELHGRSPLRWRWSGCRRCGGR